MPDLQVVKVISRSTERRKAFDCFSGIVQKAQRGDVVNVW